MAIAKFEEKVKYVTKIWAALPLFQISYENRDLKIGWNSTVFASKKKSD